MILILYGNSYGFIPKQLIHVLKKNMRKVKKNFDLLKKGNTVDGVKNKFTKNLIDKIKTNYENNCMYVTKR